MEGRDGVDCDYLGAIDCEICISTRRSTTDLLELISLYRAFSPLFLGRLGRSLSFFRKMRVLVDLSMPVSDSFCHAKGRGCGGKKTV